MTELTLRQTRFVEEYVVSGNAAAAARAAGYAPNAAKVTACRMLTRDNLKAAIEAKKRAAAEQFELRKEHVITGIMQAIAHAKVLGKPGIMISGWVAIGKMMGFFESGSIKAETQLKAPSSGNDLRFVPTSELMRRISEDARMRNPDGSAMTPAQIDGFYQSLSTEDVLALAEGRARIVMQLSYIDRC